MKIELLFTPECPNRLPALKRLTRLMSEHGLPGLVEEIEVSDASTAARLDFPGSPTVRIDGRDVHPGEASAAGLACRVYWDGALISGLPPEASIVAAIERARDGEIKR